MRRYIWEATAWPQLTYDEAAISGVADDASFAAGRLAGALSAIGSVDRAALARAALAATAHDTSQIEGELISAASIRASLARRLDDASAVTDARADAIVALTVDAANPATETLTAARLLRWHRALFPDAPRSMTVGAWRPERDDPMRVVSGPVSARVVHFEAPPAARIAAEMESLFAWFASTSTTLAPIVVAALAHLRFLTIHPFADGNGRLARAIADAILANARPEAAPYLSLSRQILAERTGYYDALERAQRGDLDVTSWITWFIRCYCRAAEHTIATVNELIAAGAFWRNHDPMMFNARQRAVLERYLAGGFDGWINSTKYAKIAKTSPDTALRDIDDLVKKQILVANPGKARNTSYRLA